MSEPLRPASFKGVEFRVLETTAEQGRRNVLHEYPFRDIPYGEDLGLAADSIFIRGYFKTLDEFKTFESEAIKSAGPGTLIHPWLGTYFVQLDGKAKITFPKIDGGLITFDMTFNEAGENTEPNASDDTDALLDMAADSVLDQINNLFEQNWLGDIEGWIEEGLAALNGLFDTLESYLGPFDKAMAWIDRIQNALQGFINNPLGIAGKIQSRIDSIMNLGKFSGMSAVRNLLNGKVLSAFNKSDDNSIAWNGNKPSLPSSSPPDWTIPDSDPQPGDMPPLPPALADLVRVTLLVETARTLPYSEFDSKIEVAEARNQLMQWLDREIKNAPDELYQSLKNLQITTAEVFLSQQQKARDIAIITTKATLPALVIAYNENGNINAVPDLIARNNISHPGFVPAGRVEVLKDGQ